MEVLKPVTAEWTRLFDGCLVPSQDVDVGEEIGRGMFYVWRDEFGRCQVGKFALH